MPMLDGEKIAPWIQTLRGRAFDFERMENNCFDYAEVATVLSRVPRFSGHTKWTYSVAQHSVLVSRRFRSPSLQRIGLLHDAPEAFIGDVSAPFKYWLRDYGATEAVDMLEDRIWHWIASIHNLDDRELVKQEDLAALATEARDLMICPPPRPWIQLPSPWPERVEPWSQEYASDEWRRVYEQIA